MNEEIENLMNELSNNKDFLLSFDTLNNTHGKDLINNKTLAVYFYTAGFLCGSKIIDDNSR